MTLRLKNGILSIARDAWCDRHHTLRGISSFPITVETLIIGGGPIGSSTAYHLSEFRKHNDDAEIVVLEQDPTYQSSSAKFSTGGIRQQFSLAENVKMSHYGVEFLRNFKNLMASPSTPDVDIQFQENGYLFLASSSDDVSKLQRMHSQVQLHGDRGAIQLMDRGELTTNFPWLNVDDVALGCYGTSGEGWFDPLVFMRGLKDKAKDNGVKYEDALVLDAERDKETGNVVSIMVQNQKTWEIQTYHPRHVVNATGARAQSLMTLLAGHDMLLEHQVPVKPRKRSVFQFQCKANQQDGLMIPQIAPMTIDSFAVYFRSDGKPGSGGFLCGVSPPEDEDVDCWDPDELAFPDHHLFENIIRPSLARRVPAFESSGSIEITSSWAGLYDYNIMDQNAIIDFHPEMPNVFMVNGFSGHGLQHSPAAGRAAAEKLEYGTFVSLDLGLFSFDRVVSGRHAIVESSII